MFTAIPTPLCTPVNQMRKLVLLGGGALVAIIAAVVLWRPSGAQTQDPVTVARTLTAADSAGYEIDLGGGGSLTPYAHTYYSSEFTANDVVYGSDRVSVQPSYTKTDLRLSWAPRNKHFRVQGFVENLENEPVLIRIVRGGDNFLQGGYAAPRTWGVKLSYRR